ncbi:MAG: outer membrane channel protein TolC [Gammaproteobacteria bacterium]|nr:outer membrane channel protein TolC [Gammaproteobacteria bacterium]
MRKTFLSASVAALLSGLSLSAEAVNLLEAYNDAVKNDPQTLIAKAQYDIAREGETATFAKLLPQINATAGYSLVDTENYTAATDTLTDLSYDELSYGVSLSQTIFSMGSWYELDSSEKAALKAQADFDLAQQSLISRVTNAYFNVLKAKDSLEFVQAEKKAIERQLEQTKQRFQVGLTAITDVHEAQANFDAAVAREIRSQNDIEIQKEALREITGKYYNDFDGLNTERFDAAMPSPSKIQNWVTKSENNNLELKAKELQVEAAKFDIKRANAGHFPTLSLSAGLSNRERGEDLADPGINTTSIGLSLNVPLYSGGATSAAVRQAQANYVIASESMELTHRAVVRQVRSSYADVVALVSSLRALEQAVVSAESALKATQAGFEVGTRTIVDVLNSTQNLYNAKRNLSNTRYDYILATLSLKQASGSLNANDVTAVNQGLIK